MAMLKLGELLVKEGVVGEAELQSALREQQRTGGRLGELLVRLKLVNEAVLVRTLAAQLGVPAVDLDVVPEVPATLKHVLPATTAQSLQCVGLRFEKGGDALVVATTDPRDASTLEALRKVTGCEILPVLAGREAILRALQRFYGLPMVNEVAAEAPRRRPARARPRKADALVGGEAAALRALVDLLVERGVISREELLNRVKG